MNRWLTRNYLWVIGVIIAILVIVIGIAWWATGAQACSPIPDEEAMSFPDFVSYLSTAKADQYVDCSGYAVQNDEAFEQMRQYLLNYYSGETVTQTLRPNASGAIDCVPISQQPGLHGSGTTTVATPPSNPRNSGISTSHKNNKGNGQQNDMRAKSEPPNGGGCADGTIPIPRGQILTSLAQYSTLDAYEAANQKDAP